jgi:hypothetical protein
MRRWETSTNLHSRSTQEMRRDLLGDDPEEEQGPRIILTDVIEPRDDLQQPFEKRQPATPRVPPT